MELSRHASIAFLVAVIGMLFAVLTYLRESIALGTVGVVAMLVLYFASRDYVA